MALTVHGSGCGQTLAVITCIVKKSKGRRDEKGPHLHFEDHPTEDDMDMCIKFNLTGFLRIEKGLKLWSLRPFLIPVSMTQFRKFYFGLALGYLLCNWLSEFISPSGLYKQKLLIETIVLVINMGFLLLYSQYENAGIKIALIFSQLLAAGLYGFFTIRMFFTEFSILSFILYDLFLFFNITFFNQLVFKKSL